VRQGAFRPQRSKRRNEATPGRSPLAGVRFLPGRRVLGCVLVLSAAPALSQTSERGAEVSREATPVEQQSRALRVSPVSFDLAGGTSIDGQIQGAYGAQMGSSSAYAQLAVMAPIGGHLGVRFAVDGATTFYRFSGDPFLVPGGGIPWDEVRSSSIGLQAMYVWERRWALILAGNVASAGVRGASFSDTLTGGGTVGFSYTFPSGLLVGVLVTAQSKLSGGVFALPFPLVDWTFPFDRGRWRLSAGGLRVGPGRAGGVSLEYSPLATLSFSAALTFLGLGREFRMSSTGPVLNGVGRDTAYPLIVGIEWNPVHALSVSAYGGVSLLRAVTVLDGSGNTLGERDVTPSPVVGGKMSLGF
jgi:hypothetical protein